MSGPAAVLPFPRAQAQNPLPTLIGACSPRRSPSPPPDTYCLLAVFSGIPLQTVPALKRSGLWRQDDDAPITDHQRALLRLLANDGRIRWVTWGPDGPGYVLTGIGEAALDIYHQRYGPAHAPRRGPPLADTVRRNQARDTLVGLLERRKTSL